MTVELGRNCFDENARRKQPTLQRRFRGTDHGAGFGFLVGFGRRQPSSRSRLGRSMERLFRVRVGRHLMIAPRNEKKNGVAQPSRLVGTASVVTRRVRQSHEEDCFTSSRAHDSHILLRKTSPKRCSSLTIITRSIPTQGRHLLSTPSVSRVPSLDCVASAKTLVRDWRAASR